MDRKAKESVTNQSEPSEERWRSLCAQVEKEEDPKTLLSLIQEMNRILKTMERELLEAKKRARAQIRDCHLDNLLTHGSSIQDALP